MAVHILYIPGLGGQYDFLRRACLRTWRIWGATARLAEVDWEDGKDFAQKMKAVSYELNQVKANTKVVIVGESAGAALALHVANDSRVARVITICGATQPAMPVLLRVQLRAPALLPAVRSIPQVANADIHSVRAAYDRVIAKKYSVATGSARHVVWLAGHAATIAACLTILSPLMVTIAKKSKT